MGTFIWIRQLISVQFILCMPCYFKSHFFQSSLCQMRAIGHSNDARIMHEKTCNDEKIKCGNGSREYNTEV